MYDQLYNNKHDKIDSRITNMITYIQLEKLYSPECFTD